MDFQVGQRIVYVPNHRNREPREVVVEKVGRKWISLDNGLRVDKVTGSVDGHGYTSPGECYPYLETYQRWIGTVRAWESFRLEVGRHYSVPRGVTLAQIENARRALFKELPPNG